MKITTADKWFSLCVRERSDWTCEKCGKHYEPEYTAAGLPSNPGLHCSHFYGRGIWATRTNPDNAFAHCYYCHVQFEMNPRAFNEWAEEKLGTERADILLGISLDAYGRGKTERRGHKDGEAAKHYKAEFERIRKLREQGKRGRIDFVGWQ